MEYLDRPLVVGYSKKKLPLAKLKKIILKFILTSYKGFKFALNFTWIYRNSSCMMSNINRRKWRRHPSLFMSTLVVFKPCVEPGVPWLLVQSTCFSYNLFQIWWVYELWLNCGVFFFPLVFILAFCPHSSGSSSLLLSHWQSLFFEVEGDIPGQVNGRANKPPLHRCTSWSQCLGSVWLGGWWDRGTALCSPPLWAPSAEFGKKSDTCCLPLEALCGSPLQEEENCN